MAGKSNKAALAAKAAAAAKKKAQKAGAAASKVEDVVEQDDEAPQRSVTGVLASRPTSRDLKIDNFSLGLNGVELIQDCSIELTIGRRYGLLGQNGCGKTNFLDCLAKREVPIPEHMDMYHLREEAKPSDRTALESVVDHIREEIKKLEALEESIMADSGPDDERLEGIYERLDSLDPATFESRAAELLHGLGFGPAMMKKATKDMSGGWRMRVALARALFAEPTILLLDEPTNHLDLEACVWLEGFLKEYKKCLVLISHSQDFLNGVCTHIIWLTQNKLTYYTGNYDTYCRTVKENNVLQMKKYEKEQDDIKHLKAFISSCGTYSNLVKQAKSKQKILDKMEADGLTKPVHSEKTIQFKFPACEKLPPPVLPFIDVAFSYSGKKEDHLYENMNLAIDCDSRVALVGPNGAGKSTLLKLILGQITPTVGTIAKHSHLSIAHYHQHSTEVLDGKATVLEYFQAQFPNTMTFTRDLEGWRAFLGRYGVSGRMQTTKIAQLSEGQQSRIVFACMCMTNPNLLLLDEPTNHLDMEAIDALAEAINSYNGGLMLVSHDFRLIDQVAKDIWICANKQVKLWEGDIRSYKKMLIQKCGYKAGDKPATVSK
jgi:ATP-binding cassette subfamily F protein 2